MTRFSLLAAVLGLASGCTSLPALSPPPEQGGGLSHPAYTGRVYAVTIGVSQYDPAYTDQTCPGADLDAHNLAADLYVDGADPIILVDSAATWRGYQTAQMAVADCIRPDDLYVLTISTHGKQVMDLDGDEIDDGLDEAVCMYDRTVLDDEWAAELARLPPCRVLIISDTCHAATGWRRLARKLTLGRAYKPVPMLLDVPELSHLQIIQIAMSAADAVAWGDDGGVGTNTLRKLRRPGISLWNLFCELWRAMPADQKPVWVQSANTLPRFIHGEAFR